MFRCGILRMLSVEKQCVVILSSADAFEFRQVWIGLKALQVTVDSQKSYVFQQDQA